MVNVTSPEFNLFTFFDRTPDLVCVSGRDGFFKKVNPAVIDKLAYSEEELYSRPINSFVYDEDKELTDANSELLIKDKVLHNFINRYVTGMGEIVWLEWTSLYFSEGELVLAIAKDITERKNTEKQVEEDYTKFKGLASYFKTTIEEDRKYFAYELHEELGQLAAVIKLDVNWIANNTNHLPESAKNRIEHAIMTSGLLIKKIQKISFSVSPHMMDLFGLKHTMELLCSEFSNINGMSCSFETKYDEARLTEEMKIDLFRICQETLAVITDRAVVSNARITIEDIEDKVQLTILDECKATGVDRQNRNVIFGSVLGRVASMNGVLNIQTLNGGGTKVCVTVAR